MSSLKIVFDPVCSFLLWYFDPNWLYQDNDGSGSYNAYHLSIVPV